MREGEEEKNWMECGEKGKMVLLPVGDWRKSGGSQCGVGKCPKQQRTGGMNAR